MNKSFILIFILIISACEIQYGEVEPPPRPPSVPKSALWIGGPVGDGFIEITKGGVYVDISKTEIRNIYLGTIYANVTGATLYTGKFKYTGKNDFMVNNKTSYSFWDGDYLFLKNKEKLIAISTD